MLIKSALRDLLSVSYGMISILVISRYAAPPYPAAPDFPPSGGQNKTPQNILFISISTVSTGCCATSKRGKGGGASHQRGNLHRPPGRLYGFRRQRRHKKMAPKAPYFASAAILYNSRGREPSTRPGGVSRSRTEPLAPRAKGPAAPSTLTPVRACQPSGIRSSATHDTTIESIYKGVHHETF